MMGNCLSWALVCLVGLSLTSMNTAAAAEEVPAPAKSETPAERDARMAWWREARFGMFIHWGVYSVPAGEWNGQEIPGAGEWIMHTGKIPVADYAKLPAQFNPTKFDADAWVSLAKAAGMKYIVITSKHHDGFAMFRTAASPFNIYDATPFKRDPLKELAAACEKQGIRLGFYYSEAQDWHHPGGSAIGGHWDKAQDGDMDQYINTIAIPQVKEILSNYGKISVLWWDTPEGMTQDQAQKLKALLALQPGIITNNRLGGGEAGDTETPEQFIPATGISGRDWETCMTMNNTWGFKKHDQEWKSTETLIRNLADIASKGGNYLLNVGPTAEGEIPQVSVERLQAVGQWMKVNGDSIYGTTASPFRRLTWGCCTAKPGRLYLHVFNWPADGQLRLPGLKNKVQRATLLADSARAPFAITAGEGGVTLTLTGAAPDLIDSVIVAEIDGAPQVETAPIEQAADGTTLLTAADAEITGQAARYQDSEGRGNIGFWTNTADTVSWPLRLAQPGEYAVELSFACDKPSAGSEYVINLGEASVTGKVEATDNWDHFVTRHVGTVKLTQSGPLTVTVKATRMPAGAVMNLESVRLVPAAQK